jgi:hypothetical protein
MLSLIGLAIMRGPVPSVQDLVALLTVPELRALVARLIDHLDALEPDPDAEPDADAELDPDGEPGEDDEPVMVVPPGDEWPHQASADQVAHPVTGPVFVVRTGETPDHVRSDGRFGPGQASKGGNG